MASLIGLGVWYSSYALEEERDLLEKGREQLAERLHLQRMAFAETIKVLPSDEQSKFILHSAKLFKDLYTQRQFEPVLDLSGVLAAVDPENGHALYFEGEAQRSLHQRTDMRGSFQKYLQAADHHPEALDGDAHDCYERPGGYCRERTAWINHLMANDYHEESQTFKSSGEVSRLSTALNYERHVLEIRPRGFYSLESIQSSCELLQGVTKRLGSLGQTTSNVDAILKKYHDQFGPC